MAILVAVLVSVLSFGASAQDLFLETEYYIISMGAIALDQAALIDTARSNGYTVVVRSADAMMAYRGGTESTDEEELLLEDRPLLYVDHADTLLAVAGTDYDFTLRPGANGYDLVLSPHVAVPVGATFGAALTQLYALGIIGSTVGVDAPLAFSKTALKGPRPPEGVPIDSDLYGLVVAEDWFLAAAMKGIPRVGLRVEVIAEKLEGAMMPPDYQPFLVEETTELARFLVPIHHLVGLAGSGAFQMVRPAYVPQPASS
jgi:hypothetical protein